MSFLCDLVGARKEASYISARRKLEDDKCLASLYSKSGHICSHDFDVSHSTGFLGGLLDIESRCLFVASTKKMALLAFIHGDPCTTVGFLLHFFDCLTMKCRNCEKVLEFFYFWRYVNLLKKEEFLP